MLRSLIPWIEPLSIVWIVLSLGWCVSAIRRRWLASSAFFLAWVVLTAVACMPLPSVLLVDLEKQFPAAAPESIAACDVIVCLGGGIEPAPKEPSGIHLKRGSDRVSTALVLATRHEIPHLVLGGGAYGGDPEWHSEADEVAALLREMGITGLEIHSLGICENTRDEAEKVALLVKEKDWKSIGLITSAGHMPRAHATFEKAGVPTLAIPCNYLSSHMRLGALHWFHPPGAEGLIQFRDWLHEFIGTWFYRSKGWI